MKVVKERNFRKGHGSGCFVIRTDVKILESEFDAWSRRNQYKITSKNLIGDTRFLVNFGYREISKRATHRQTIYQLVQYSPMGEHHQTIAQSTFSFKP